uniref:Uncharacterized protein n=1 Tax=candidate division WOR-3 bacterium TaxID=2052148 RepID=A0A7C6A8A7_UNCW3
MVWRYELYFKPYLKWLMIIAGILIIIGIFTIYRSCSRLFNPPVRVSKIIPFSIKEGKGMGEIPIQKSIKLFGTQKSELAIKIPPQPKPVELKVTEDLKVFPKTSDSSEIKKSYTLIRFHPTFHLTVLCAPFTILQTKNFEFFPGLKLRFLEIWRFGTATYLTTKGPGLGIDFAIISNLSFDYCRLLNSHNFGLSLKL